jgi:hypothetical protein
VNVLAPFSCNFTLEGMSFVTKYDIILAARTERFSFYGLLDESHH